MSLRVKNAATFAAWIAVAEGRGLTVAVPRRKKGKVKRTPQQCSTDLERALMLATTDLARTVIGRALERMAREQEKGGQ